MNALALIAALSVTQVPVPSDAVALAYADAQRFADPRGLRYVWIWGPTSVQLREDARVVSLTLAYINRAGIFYPPTLVSNGRTLLARVDLTSYRDPSNAVNDFWRLANVWEDFRFDPRFNAFLTQGQVNLTKARVEGVSKKWKNGILEIESAADALKRDGVVRLFPQHLAKSPWLKLADLLNTEAPVVDHRYFTLRALSTIRDADKNILFATIYGGLYYQLADVPDTLDGLLRQIGAADVSEKGFNVKQVFDKIPSERRLAIEESGVTLHPRWVVEQPTRTGADGRVGKVMITGDLFKSTIDTDKHPFANLLSGFADAHEIIWVTPTGMHGFMLTDGKGKRVDEVPPDVAKDSTAPDGRLQAAIGCIRCHGTERGWRSAKNEVLQMLKGGKWNVFGDLSERDQEDARTRIAQLYQGDFVESFARGRDDYTKALLPVTGPWPGSRDQTDTVLQSARRTERVYGDFYFTRVTAQQAMAEMGFRVGEAKAKAAFERYVTVPAPITIQAHPVAQLINGIEPGRMFWDLVYGNVYRGR